jgi:hypothetical protein
VAEGCVFVTTARHAQDKRAVRLLLESIRTFGGPLRACPVWVFAVDPEREPCTDLAASPVRVIPLAVPDDVAAYWFGGKVLACARAEELAGKELTSLIWLDPFCIVLQPPVLFDLGTGCDAAVRPVHVRNVGLPPSAPLDAFWRGVYAECGLDDVSMVVSSFVEDEPLRAYFNSHGLSVRPGLGLFRRWSEHFVRLVRDEAFQATACADERHRVFLFQAVLSTLLAGTLDRERIRFLPWPYNYPYHLQQQVPPQRRARALNDLVCLGIDAHDLDPDTATDIEIREPLRSWLRTRLGR